MHKLNDCTPQSLKLHYLNQIKWREYNNILLNRGVRLWIYCAGSVCVYTQNVRTTTSQQPIGCTQIAVVTSSVSGHKCVVYHLYAAGGLLDENN